jgi:hypothetical protein
MAESLEKTQEDTKKVVEYIEMSVVELDKPKEIVETTKRAVKYVLLGMKKKKSFKKELVEMYTKRKVRVSTKRERKQKGVWLVIILLVKIV